MGFLEPGETCGRFTGTGLSPHSLPPPRGGGVLVPPRPFKKNTTGGFAKKRKADPRGVLKGSIQTTRCQPEGGFPASDPFGRRIHGWIHGEGANDQKPPQSGYTKRATRTKRLQVQVASLGLKKKHSQWIHKEG